MGHAFKFSRCTIKNIRIHVNTPMSRLNIVAYIAAFQAVELWQWRESLNCIRTYFYGAKYWLLSTISWGNWFSVDLVKFLYNYRLTINDIFTQFDNPDIRHIDPGDAFDWLYPIARNIQLPQTGKTYVLNLLQYSGLIIITYIITNMLLILKNSGISQQMISCMSHTIPKFVQFPS